MAVPTGATHRNASQLQFRAVLASTDFFNGCNDLHRCVKRDSQEWLSYESAPSVFAAQSGNTTGRDILGPPALAACTCPVPSTMSRLEFLAAS